MPVLTWTITMLLRIGVRMTIFGPMMLLTVRGRKTGKPRTQPVDLHDHDGRRFLTAACVQVHVPSQRELADVLIVDLLQGAEALFAVSAPVAHPVAGLLIGVDQA